MFGTIPTDTDNKESCGKRVECSRMAYAFFARNLADVIDDIVACEAGGFINKQKWHKVKMDMGEQTAPRILLYGPPGAGKDTQATRLAEAHGLVVISLGRLLRAEIANNTPLGQYAKPYVDDGELPPGNMGTLLLREKVLEMQKNNQGFVLIGYPRTMSALIIAEEFLQPTHIIHLSVPKEDALKRDTNVPHWEKRWSRYIEDEAEVLKAFKRGKVPFTEIDGLRPREEIAVLIDAFVFAK